MYVYEVRKVPYTFVLPGANIVQPQISYAEAYNAPLGNMGNLNPNGGGLRTLTVRLPTPCKPWEIDTEVLVAVFGRYNRTDPQQVVTPFQASRPRCLRAQAYVPQVRQYEVRESTLREGCQSDLDRSAW